MSDRTEADALVVATNVVETLTLINKSIVALTDTTRMILDRVEALEAEQLRRQRRPRKWRVVSAKKHEETL